MPNQTPLSALRCLFNILLIGIFCLDCGQSYAAIVATSATMLQNRYTELTDALHNNQFNRELYMESVESSHDLKGEVYAVVNHPFAEVNQALNNPQHWCDILILHLNIKYCRAEINPSITRLNVNLGRKFDQPLADTYRTEFIYRSLLSSSDYFSLELNAAEGPMSTHDYHIGIEAIALNNRKTFLHFTYAYGFGFTGRIAMQAYLATLGSDKIGFTLTGHQIDGKPEYIHGVRGVIERNIMRYYISIDAYLAAMNTPPGEQFENQIKNWYDATDQYAPQLHEMERDEYLQMKRKERQRQQTSN
jgi:hypothetical protein